MQEVIEVPIGNLKFSCRIAGNTEHELILFLHGFPETSHMWKTLMNELASQGFYCVAPNLRGFSKGACPKGKQNYTLQELTGDVLDIAGYFKKPKFHLVGHDWGAAIGWKVVHDHKQSILSWTAISVPHLQAFGNAIVNDPEQRRMSAYIRRFQWPWLPEFQISKNDLALFRKLWKYSEPEEVEDYLSVFRNRKQLTATLNYYRANNRSLRHASRGRILGNIHVPTLFIWGNRDVAIGQASVQNSHRYMKSDYDFLELDSGHWLIQTNYNDLKRKIGAHIGKYRDSP